MDAAFVETNPVPAKWIMEQLGIIGSGWRGEPLAPLSAASQGRIAEILESNAHVKFPPSARAACSWGRKGARDVENGLVLAAW